MSERFIVGNWKMNLLRAEASDLALALKEIELPKDTSLWIAPNFTLITELSSKVEGSAIQIGAQNCHWEDSGAFTGEVSPQMLRDSGATFTLVGHSERRQLFHDSLEECGKRAASALKSGLQCIFCVGETETDRDGGKTFEVIQSQLRALFDLKPNELDKLIIAYEPVWAIGTGKVATLEQIAEVHEAIDEFTKENLGTSLTILYGGSVNPDNAAGILGLERVSGALIGGASLSADKLRAIIEQQNHL